MTLTTNEHSRSDQVIQYMAHLLNYYPGTQWTAENFHAFADALVDFPTSAIEEACRSWVSNETWPPKSPADFASYAREAMRPEPKEMGCNNCDNGMSSMVKDGIEYFQPCSACNPEGYERHRARQRPGYKERQRRTSSEKRAELLADVVARMPDQQRVKE